MTHRAIQDPAPFCLPLADGGRYIVLSDCHRGNGSAGDEFAHNSLIYKCALEHYFEQGFTYIELGDAEELWENESFDAIYITHTSIYDLLRRFHDPDPAKTRYIKIWGNHDADWRNNPAPLRAIFPGIEVHETVILQAAFPPVLLLHGHQADPSCLGVRAKISRFIVRHVWSGFQRLGILDPTRAAENPGRCNEIDETLYHWAKGSNKGDMKDAIHFSCRGNREASRVFPDGHLIIITGHTHRPVFANLSLTERRLMETGIGSRGVRGKAKADPIYFNTGSCVHPRCITGIEITAEKEPDDEAPRLRYTLVKWGFSADAACAETNTGADAEGACFPLAIRRTVLEE